MNPKLSICIPTYNRSKHLSNCLQSLILNKNIHSQEIQVCVSDNCSIDDTEMVVRHAQEKIDIVYHKNEENIGIPRNFLNVVDMASGEFVWLIGDDDLLIPTALEDLLEIINQNNNVDFFYINSFHLTSEYVFDHPQPFDTINLPIDMERFSLHSRDGQMNFMDLIDPSVSFDFLGGMFLSVFRRKNWIQNTNVLDRNAIYDKKTFSHFDNTFPHVKIFATAFSNSKAYFNSTPLSVCLTGVREWAPMYPFVKSVRLVEALDEYRKNGLPYRNYWRCKNFALRNFIPDIGYTIFHKKVSGYEYLKPLSLIVRNCLYPEFYLSFFRFIIRKLKGIFNP